MKWIQPCLWAVLLPCFFSLPKASAQPGPGNVDREAMWPAPTAEDWQKPCLIQWQRTYEDALAVSKETGQAILICVNMDGEIASEHYAGIRYRQPEIAKLYEPYVCVIASVYRHNPRDYDEEGRRILCPRFGTVTCGEHIAIEPGLYTEFFDGRRIAPRHIGVELDGEEMYDVYYAWDTDSVFQAVEDGIENRPDTPPPPPRGDRSLVERVASRDNVDQTAVEAAYQQGSGELRKALLDAAVEQGDATSVDLLRLAVFGFDIELSQIARQSLALANQPAATELITDALHVPMGDTEREALVAALERIGAASPRARTLAVVHQGLGSESEAVDVATWNRALESASGPTTAIDAYVKESRLQEQDEVLRGDDAAAHVELAEALLDQAFAADAGDDHARLLFMDALRTAKDAEDLGAEDWRVDAVAALASYYLKDFEVATARAQAAVNALPEGEQSYNGMAVLELFAKMRWQGIVQAVNNKKDWPKQWLTDVNAACSVLARHPLGTDGQVVWHHDILRYLGAGGQASEVLDLGLRRFPDSWELHQRLRRRALREHGVDGLENLYAGMIGQEDAPANVEWFAGYASFVAAEFHRRRGREERAVSAYERAIDHYQRCIVDNPSNQETADPSIALAHGGLARLAYEAGDNTAAVEQLLASFERSPQSAATLDGLNISPVDTAKMLRARLESEGLDELRGKLQAALDGLDPELLKLPAYESEVPLAPAGQ